MTDGHVFTGAVGTITEDCSSNVIIFARPAQSSHVHPADTTTYNCTVLQPTATITWGDGTSATPATLVANSEQVIEQQRHVLHLSVDDVVAPTLLRIGRSGRLGDQRGLSDRRERVAQLVSECCQELVFTPVGIAPIALLVQLGLDLLLCGQRVSQLLCLALESGPGDRELALGLLKRAEKGSGILRGRCGRLLDFVAI